MGGGLRLVLRTQPRSGSRAEMKTGFYRGLVASVVGYRRLSEENFIPPEPAGLRQRLTELREALLALHKVLLESERASYEMTFGKITSPYQFLQLLTNDPWFAWLTPVTQLIAAMDEMLDAKAPLTVAGVDALMNQARTLLVATEGGKGFSRHYDEALQRTPDVVFAHAAAAKLIRAQAGGK
jgi:hypothetical protein